MRALCPAIRLRQAVFEKLDDPSAPSSERCLTLESRLRNVPRSPSLPTATVFYERPHSLNTNSCLIMRLFRHSSVRPILAAGILALTSTAAFAVTATWTGGGDGSSWNQGANWLGGVAPVSGAPALALNMAPFSVTNVNTGPFTLHALNYGFTYSPGTQLSGATLTFADLGTGLPAVFQTRTTTVNNNIVLATNTDFQSYQGTTLNGSISGIGNLHTFGDNIFNGPISTTGNLIFGDPSFGGGGSITAPITNAASFTVNVGSLSVSGAITGAMPVVVGNGVNNAGLTLSGPQNYTGGTTVNANAGASGTTTSIQGNWVLNGNSTLSIGQNFAGTSSSNINGTGNLTVGGATGGGIGLTGNISLTGSLSVNGNIKTVFSGNNSFGSVSMYALFGDQAWLGFGSNTAVGAATISLVTNYAPGNPKCAFSAEGGARTVANDLVFDTVTTATLEFKGTNNLTFTSATNRDLAGTIKHTSTATTVLGGAFLGQNSSTIEVSAGTLILGAAVNNGFRTDGAINVASGATLQMISSSPVKLGPTNLNGGTLVAANGVAVPTGLALTARGTIQARVSSEAGSLIEATGPLTLGDATSFGGFFSNGELRTLKHAVTLLDKNQAVLGSLTEVGDLPSAQPGTLNAANGLFVDFGRAITGWGTVAGTNTLAKATIINGDAAGASGAQPLDFTGYVKGIGTFTDVTFSGTFSPGLSPAIVPVTNVAFGPASTLLLEIGGLVPGSQHDQLTITGTLGLAGLLDVDLLNGFNPAFGDTFNVFNGTTAGTFGTFSFPGLTPGLAWDTSDLYTLGNLKVTAAPEPTSAALLLLASAGSLAVRRRAAV